MGDRIDELSRQMAATTSRREALGVLFGSLIAMVQPQCPNLAGPTRPQTGYEQCGITAQLYCNSAIVPRTLQGVQGTCCFNAFTNARIGYLCAYGSDRQVIGCYSDVQQARAACPGNPTIVRCTDG